jgi:hypothetical protein
MINENEMARLVRKAIDGYFFDLDGERPSGVYDMVIGCVEKPLLETVLHPHPRPFSRREKGAICIPLPPGEGVRVRAARRSIYSILNPRSSILPLTCLSSSRR